MPRAYVAPWPQSQYNELMSAPRVYRTEAIVLRHSRFAEADRLLTLFTPHYGKLRVVAKGVLRPTSHLAGHLETFTRSQLLLARTRTLDIVTQAQAVESYAPLREDLQRASVALYAVEVLDRLSEEHGENYPAYHLLLLYFQWLSTVQETDLPTRYFEMQLLELTGYRPELYTCLHCKRTLAPEVNAFSGVAGGVLCPPCSLGDAEARPISVTALKVLRLLQDGDLAQVRRLRLSPPLARELEQHMRHYLPHVTERELRSTAFLDAVRATQPPSTT